MLPHKTESLCPECLRRIEAEVYDDNGVVKIRKTCPEHGAVEDAYWEDTQMYLKAARYHATKEGVSNPNVDFSGKDCPFECGLCRRHKSHTSLANVVLTNRCDLSCWYCFFYAKEGSKIYDPSLEQLKGMFRNLRNEKPVPCNAVQLTGGEPTLREDLLGIIRAAKAEGFAHVQVNTNGINLALRPGLASGIRKAGANTFYLSFDGVTPKTNPKNHWEVPYALENCRAARMGVVLVPTIVRSVNDQELGDIVRFGASNMDVIRGINFQPVSLVGRVPRRERERMRITIPGAIKKIEEQTSGELSRDDFYTVPCTLAVTDFAEALSGKPKYRLSVHFACGAATYVFREGDKLLPITRFVDVEGLFGYLADTAQRIRGGSNKVIETAKVLYNLGGYINKAKAPKGLDLPGLLYDAFVTHNYHSLGKFHYKSMFVGFMHFQDLYNYDVERVERCGVHYATPDGKIIPFCAFNVLPEQYRDRIQDQYSIPQKEWEKLTGKTLKGEFYRRDAKTLAAGDAYKKAYEGFLR